MPTSRETSGLTTRLIVAHVRRHAGEAGVADLLERAGVRHPLEHLEDERRWVSYVDKIALFAAAADVLDDPEVARHVGESLLTEKVGTGLRLLLSSLGSPQQVVRSITDAQVKFSTSGTMRPLEVRPDGATVVYRLLAPHVPSHHDCGYTQGVLSQISVLFGEPAAEIEHPECQVLGAGACRYEMTWRPHRRLRRWRRASRADATSPFEVQALRDQLEDLQRTVADLVSTPDLDELLHGIAERAGATVRGQRYLLAVQLEGESTPRIHADGLTEVQSVAWGVALLEGSEDRPPDPGRLVTEVRSAQRRYGWIAAYLPRGEAFLPGEQVQLDAYGRIAAAALDSATALVEARDRGRVAQALLDLGHALASETDEVGIAQRVIEAVPTVVGAGRSSLLVWDEDAEALRSVAAFGYGERMEDALTLTIPEVATDALQQMRDDRRARWFGEDTTDPWVHDTIQRFGAVGVAAAPVLAHGELVGVVLASWTWRDHPPAPGHEDGPLERLQSLADQAGLAFTAARSLGVARHQATHDDLTGLANRVLFTDRITQALVDLRRSGRRTAVFFVDIDGFKKVNDRHGHAVGDRTLIEIAHRIRLGVRESDAVARLSGDEFGVVLRDLDDVEVVDEVASALVEALSQPIVVGEAIVRVGASIGIAIGPDHGDTPDALLLAADAAMYEVKAAGGGYLVATTPELRAPGERGATLRALRSEPRTGT